MRPVIGAGLIIIDQTEGPEALRGRKVGAGLRARQSRIGAAKRLPLPLCPFANAHFDRHLERQDMLHQSTN